MLRFHDDNCTLFGLNRVLFSWSQVLNCMGIRRWNHLFDCIRAEIFACTKEGEFFEDHQNGLQEKII